VTTQRGAAIAVAEARGAALAIAPHPGLRHVTTILGWAEVSFRFPCRWPGPVPAWLRCPRPDKYWASPSNLTSSTMGRIGGLPPPPEEPSAFTPSSHSLKPNYAQSRASTSDGSGTVDWEVELVAVNPARRGPSHHPRVVMDYVAGLTGGPDISDRTVHGHLLSTVLTGEVPFPSSVPIAPTGHGQDELDDPDVSASSARGPPPPGAAGSHL